MIIWVNGTFGAGKAARSWMLVAADLVINTSKTDAESAAAEILQHAHQAEKSISKVG